MSAGKVAACLVPPEAPPSTPPTDPPPPTPKPKPESGEGSGSTSTADLELDALERELDKTPTRKESGTVRVKVFAVDEAGREVVVGVPLRSGGRLEATARLSVVGMFKIGIPTPRGTMTKMQLHPIPVAQDALLAEAVAEALVLYDGCIEEAKAAAVAEVMGSEKRIVTAGSIPPN